MYIYHVTFGRYDDDFDVADKVFSSYKKARLYFVDIGNKHNFKILKMPKRYRYMRYVSQCTTYYLRLIRKDVL